VAQLMTQFSFHQQGTNLAAFMEMAVNVLELARMVRWL
jgi:hypothetical protein